MPRLVNRDYDDDSTISSGDEMTDSESWRDDDACWDLHAEYDKIDFSFASVTVKVPWWFVLLDNESTHNTSIPGCTFGISAGKKAY